MIDVTDNKRKVISRNKKREEKIKKSKNKIPQTLVRSSPLRALSFSSPLSPSPPHPSIPIIRYIHTYLICTVYESSSHSSSSASKVGCRSSAGGDFITHTQIWKACTQASKQASKSIRYLRYILSLSSRCFGRLVVWSFGCYMQVMHAYLIYRHLP